MRIDEPIAQAIMGNLDKETASARITCGLAARGAVQCVCGSILDQKTVTVVRVKNNGKRATQALCPACWEKVSQPLMDHLHHPKTVLEAYEITNWHGLIDGFNADQIDQ